MKKYALAILKKVDAKFIADWKNLWERSDNANIFSSPEWFELSIQSGNVETYEVFACYENVKLVAVVPLSMGRKFGIPAYTLLWDAHTVNTAFLIEKNDSNVIRFLFGEIAKRRNLYLSKIDADSAKNLKSIFPNLFHPIIFTSPYLEIDSNPLKYISKRNLKDIKKVMTREGENLEFELHDADSDLESLLPLMFKIDMKSGKKQRAREIFSKEETRIFFRNLVKYCRKFVRIGVLSYKKKPIAYVFCFEYKKTFLGYQMSYLFEYRKLAPGKIMTTVLLKERLSKNVEIFDFSGGLSTYKQEFTPHFYHQYDVYFSPNNFVMAWWKLVNLARRIKKVKFPEPYTRDHEFQYKTII